MNAEEMKLLKLIHKNLYAKLLERFNALEADTLFVFLIENQKDISTLLTLGNLDDSRPIRTFEKNLECRCRCHFSPGIKHVVPCCDKAGL